MFVPDIDETPAFRMTFLFRDTAHQNLSPAVGAVEYVAHRQLLLLRSLRIEHPINRTFTVRTIERGHKIVRNDS